MACGRESCTFVRPEDEAHAPPMSLADLDADAGNLPPASLAASSEMYRAISLARMSDEQRTAMHAALRQVHPSGEDRNA